MIEELDDLLDDLIEEEASIDTQNAGGSVGGGSRKDKSYGQNDEDNTFWVSTNEYGIASFSYELSKKPEHGGTFTLEKDGKFSYTAPEAGEVEDSVEISTLLGGVLIEKNSLPLLQTIEKGRYRDPRDTSDREATTSRSYLKKEDYLKAIATTKVVDLRDRVKDALNPARYFKLVKFYKAKYRGFKRVEDDFLPYFPLQGGAVDNEGLYFRYKSVNLAFKGNVAGEFKQLYKSAYVPLIGADTHPAINYLDELTSEVIKRNDPEELAKLQAFYATLHRKFGPYHKKNNDKPFDLEKYPLQSFKKERRIFNLGSAILGIEVNEETGSGKANYKGQLEVQGVCSKPKNTKLSVILLKDSLFKRLFQKKPTQGADYIGLTIGEGNDIITGEKIKNSSKFYKHFNTDKNDRSLRKNHAVKFFYTTGKEKKDTRYHVKQFDTPTYLEGDFSTFVSGDNVITASDLYSHPNFAIHAMNLIVEMYHYFMDGKLPRMWRPRTESNEEVDSPTSEEVNKDSSTSDTDLDEFDEEDLDEAFED